MHHTTALLPQTATVTLMNYKTGRKNHSYWRFRSLLLHCTVCLYICTLL